MEAIIIAAGEGSRLTRDPRNIPKTLLPLNGGTILSRILGNLREAGIRRYRIVLGFEGEAIRAYVAGLPDFRGEVRFVDNPSWKGGNGISVLAGGLLGGADPPVLLSMSDHLVPVEALRKVIEHDSSRNLLLVDRRLRQVFDLEDATKVRLQDARLTAIGKDLAYYNGVDCGIFRINGSMLEALAGNVAAGRESLSEAVESLIERGEMEAVEIPDSCSWLDVDTPSAYQQAVLHERRYHLGVPA